jgi:signal transduction histidine kinase
MHAPSAVATFYVASGMVYTAMPVMVWVLLRRRHPKQSLWLWCGGAMLLALGMMLHGARTHTMGLPALYVAQFCTAAAAALQAGALRLEAGRPPRLARLLAACVLGVSLLALAQQRWGTGVRLALDNLLPALFTLLLAVVAGQLARRRRSRSACLLVVLYVLLSLALLLRLAQRALALPGDPPGAPDTVLLAVIAFLLVTGVATQVAYLGLALDRARDAEGHQREALQALHRQQLALEGAARGREMVASERARTTQLLAHEVRQPLHNAAVSLQRALATLGQVDDPRAAAAAIEQAQEVIRAVSATLDNTVAATTLLAGQSRASTVDVDLPLLLELCLGDLPPEARQRVRVDYRADARSAQLEPTLLRLALRNLLANATLYAPRETPVVLRVLDSDEPLALVIEVADEGPGIPEELRARVFDEGVRGEQPTVPGHGLGLHVVKRVAQLHGGRIDYAPNTPQGSVFRLTLPQGEGG